MKMISHTPNERPDANSISGWVNEHQKALSSESNDVDMSSKGTTHRSNSSPSQMSLYRSDSAAGSTSSNSNDNNGNNATSWVKGIRNPLTSGTKSTSHPLLKSHSFSTL